MVKTGRVEVIYFIDFTIMRNAYAILFKNNGFSIFSLFQKLVCFAVVLWPPSASPMLYPMPIHGEASNHRYPTLCIAINSDLDFISAQ